MATVDYGLGQLGSFIRGESPTFVGSMAFGTGSTGFNGSQINLDSEVIRVPISWSTIGSDSRATSTLTTVDANGSNIQELSLVFGASANGSDLFSRNLSAIGLKNNTFSVLVQQDVKLRRG